MHPDLVLLFTLKREGRGERRRERRGEKVRRGQERRKEMGKGGGGEEGRDSKVRKIMRKT